MKTIMLCSKIAHHRALAHKLSEVSSISAIGLIEPPPARFQSRVFRWLASNTVGQPLRRAWLGMTAYFERLYPHYPDCEITTHQNVNAQGVIDLVQRIAPDLVLISGTNLLQQPLIDAISRSGRVVNLHTGISPYLKGGPNCTNWCLALGEFDLIGNTLMWLDAGIDSGRIIATEQTPLSGKESLMELQIKVIEHGHDLFVRAIRRLASGESLNSVPQTDLGPGRLLLTKDWTVEQIARALFNYYRRYNALGLKSSRDIRLVSLDDVKV